VTDDLTQRCISTRLARVTGAVPLMRCRSIPGFSWQWQRRTATPLASRHCTTCNYTLPADFATD